MALLAEMESSEKYSEKVVKASARLITGHSKSEISVEGKFDDLRNAVFRKLDETVLAKVAAESTDLRVRAAAVKQEERRQRSDHPYHRAC